MDLATLIGIISGLALIAGTMAMGGSIGAFVNAPGLLIVVGGTFAATLINESMSHVIGAVKVSMQAFFDRSSSSEGMIQQIVDLQNAELGRRLADQGVGLELDDAARELVARAGYDPVYGARPLKRYLQRELETRIGRALIAGDLGAGATVRVGVEGGELAVQLEPLVAAELAGGV